MNSIEQALREKAPEIFGSLALRPVRQIASADDAVERARAYLRTIEPAIEGQGGDHATFRVACVLVRDFGLTDDNAMALISEWNATCVPPWSAAELGAKIRSAGRSGSHPVGGKLADVSERRRSTAVSVGGTETADAEADSPLILDPADPLPSARAFIDASHTAHGVMALRCQNGLFYAYIPQAGAYQERDEAAIRADLYGLLEPAQRWTDAKPPAAPSLVAFKPNKAKVENVLDALKAVCNLPASVASPCWLGKPRDIDPLDVVPCRNGLLHIPTRTLIPSTPDFFTLNGLDFAYAPAAPPPTHWFAFLATLWPDDQPSRDALQEWIGYLLTPRTHHQKILMLIGPKRSGKGTIGRVTTQLLGRRNVCAPTLANMGEQFGRSILIDKSVAIIADARIGGRTDTAVVAEQLLSISGEDGQTIPRKFLPDWNGKLLTRFMLMTNELPRIDDASGALASRFLMLTLDQSFYGREDHGLLDRLVPELPGILNWALAGWNRLARRGRFLQPESANEMIQQFNDLGSPISAFVRDRCEVGRGYEVSQARVFEAWKTWCQETGRDRPGTIQTLGRNLRASGPRVGETQPRVAGTRVRYYTGIRLQEAE